MTPSNVYLGFDLGTTVFKTAAVDEQGQVVCRASRPTPWVRPSSGGAELDAATLLAVVDSLLEEVVSTATNQIGTVAVTAMGFTSIGESGVLVDSADQPLAPIIAWYDRRGEQQLQTMDADVATDFPAITGLSVSRVASIFKLAWMRDQGIDLRGSQWFCIPEFICSRLGGRRVSELSLLGRTGFLDIHSLEPWTPSLEFLGVTPSFIPELVGAGQPLGRVSSDHPVAAVRGAVLCVAGHDHLVAAAAAGAAEPGSILNSMGTAEALVVAMDSTPSPQATKELRVHGLSIYPHVVKDTTALIAGLRTGLVGKRLLRLLDADSPARRDELDRLAMEVVDHTIDDVVISGLAMGEEAVGIQLLSDDIDPVRAWAAVVTCSRDIIAGILATMRRYEIAIDELVLTGGWSQMESLRSAREDLAPVTRQLTLEQPGSWGAAQFARWASEQEGEPLAPLARPPASFFDHP